MPSKIRQEDWGRLFAPRAHRRGGPLHAFGHVLIVLVVLGLLSAGGVFAFDYRNRTNAIAALTATAFAQNVAPGLTATALVAASATAQPTPAPLATAPARSTPAPAGPTLAPAIGSGLVLNGGNMRSEPRRAANTVIGLVWPNDEISFLERRETDGLVWFRVVLVRPAANRGGQGVGPGVEGWVADILLSPVTPVPR